MEASKTIAACALAAVLCAAAWAGEAGRAKSLFGEGRFAEALESYIAEAGGSDSAWSALLGAADCLSALGRTEEAEAKYLDLMCRAPAGEFAMGGNLEKLYPNWWRQVQRTGRLGEAEHMLRLALEKDGRNLVAVQYLAVALHMQARLPEALGAYERALSIQGENEWTRFNMAILLERMGMDSEAAESYLKAVSLNPANAGGAGRSADGFARVNSLCYRWSAQRRFEEAKRTWEALAAVRDLPAGRRALTRLNLGILFMNHGMPEAAGEQFRGALEAAPSMTEAHNNIGLVMWSQGNMEGAKKEFSAVVGAPDSDSTNGHENIGNLELAAGNPGRALKYFEAGLEKARLRRQKAAESLRIAAAPGTAETALFEAKGELDSAEYAVYRLRCGVIRAKSACASK